MFKPHVANSLSAEDVSGLKPLSSESSSILAGKPILGFNVRKWADVSVINELMSSPTYTSGLELITASASLSIVNSCSLLRHNLPIAFRSLSKYMPTAIFFCT